jgi:hypothetical protein
MVLSHITRGFMGLSGTIVRVMVLAGVSAGGFGANQWAFFSKNMNTCMHVCVYICVYTYKKGHII